MTTTNTAEFTLVLTDDERRELRQLLEGQLVETHAEKRRTEAPAYQQEVHDREDLIRGLLNKVTQASRKP